MRFLNIRSKCRQLADTYLLILILIVGVPFFCISTIAQAQEMDFFKETYLLLDPISNQVIPISNQVKPTEGNANQEKKSVRDIDKDYVRQCIDKMKYHFDEGMRCFKEAEDACLLFPTLSDKEKAQFCFSNITATAKPGTPKVKIVAKIIDLCAQSGSMVMNEWQHIDSRLHQAKYHWEMEALYRMNANHVADRLNAQRKNVKTDKG